MDKEFTQLLALKIKSLVMEKPGWLYNLEQEITRFIDEVKERETNTMRHVHADLIHAWAEGAIIQYRYGASNWLEVPDNNPSWDESAEYRIKPEVKPDIIRHLRVEVGYEIEQFMNFDYRCGGYPGGANLKLTFDGETGDIKSAEVIK